MITSVHVQQTLDEGGKVVLTTLIFVFDEKFQHRISIPTGMKPKDFIDALLDLIGSLVTRRF